jgi:hypothetical protein
VCAYLNPLSCVVVVCIKNYLKAINAENISSPFGLDRGKKARKFLFFFLIDGFKEIFHVPSRPVNKKKSVSDDINGT